MSAVGGPRGAALRVASRSRVVHGARIGARVSALVAGVGSRRSRDRAHVGAGAGGARAVLDERTGVARARLRGQRRRCVLFAPSADDAAAACVRRIVGQWIPFRIHLGAPAIFSIEHAGSIGWPCVSKSMGAEKGALSAKAAAARAAKLANEACQRRFGVRPFRAEHWPIVHGEGGRWTSGHVDPAGVCVHSISETWRWSSSRFTPASPAFRRAS